jgi:LPS export ABC transporter protein LptC
LKILGLFLIFTLLLTACSNDLERTKKEKNNMPVRSELGTNVRVYYSEHAQRKAILTSANMFRREDTMFKTYFPEGVRIEMFDSLGNIATVITSKYGEQNHNNNEMIARDSVQVQNVNGKTLKTNDLIWIPNENRMISYGAVEIRDGQEVIYGDTLFGDENLKRYVVKKVRGRVLVTK